MTQYEGKSEPQQWQELQLDANTLLMNSFKKWQMIRLSSMQNKNKQRCWFASLHSCKSQTSKDLAENIPTYI